MKITLSLQTNNMYDYQLYIIILQFKPLVKIIKSKNESAGKSNIVLINVHF